MTPIDTKSLKLFFLIGIQYLRRSKGWIALGFAVILIIIFAQVKFNIFYSNNSLSEGLIGTYQEYDLPIEVTKLISQSLVEADANGRIKPKLVSGWETNNDATIFTFKLKENLKWSDNTEVKSWDFEFNIPNTEVSMLDAHTIQFKLKESYSALPSLLIKPIFKKGTGVGTGPYKISKIKKSRIFITKISLVPATSDLPKLFIRFYPNERVAITGFNMGEVQTLLGLANLKLMTGNPQVKIRQKTDFQKIVTILYYAKDPLLSNRSLRQALSFQTPQIDQEEVANNPFPSFYWARDSDAKKYLSNTTEAHAALDRAKSVLSDDKLKQDLILTATPNLEEIGKKIVSSWKDLSLNAKLRIESGIPQNFQTLLITQSIPNDPDQYFLWHSSQEKTNLSKYSSARVDKDLEDGRKALTEEDRKARYYDFQKTLLEDAPATFLYFPKYNILYLKKVEPLLDKVLGLQLP